MLSENHRKTIISIFTVIFTVLIFSMQLIPNLKHPTIIYDNIQESQLPYQPLDVDGRFPVGNMTLLTIDNLGIGTFALASVMALAIAVGTVSYQSLKAALTNPADSLRYE